MKTLTFYFAIIIITISNNLNAQNFDFRNTKWGMDSVQVKKAEASKLIFSKKNNLIYSGKLGELDAKIVYNFNLSNKLYHSSYLINFGNNASKNPYTYVNDFLMLQEILAKKYSDPYSKVSTTINGKVITQEEWASNLISDNLYLETKWKTDRTDIILSLFSINDELYIEVNYTSLEPGINQSDEIKMQMLKDL